MTLLQLEQLIDENKLPDISQRFELKAVVDKYPYFQAGIFIYLKCLYVAEDVMFREELQRLSVFVNDRRALFYYVLESEYEQFFRKKGRKKEIGKNRTDILLNAFFETMDDSAIDAQIDSLKSGLNYHVTDYFSYINSLENEEGEQADASVPLKHQDIIDRFIDNAEDRTGIQIDFDKNHAADCQPELSEEDTAEELQDDLFFTETLANIYIKQRKYERAHEIIKRLSLNYPEKNVYFANQISFLEKLIMNANVKNKRKI